MKIQQLISDKYVVPLPFTVKKKKKKKKTHTQKQNKKNNNNNKKKKKKKNIVGIIFCQGCIENKFALTPSICVRNGSMRLFV